MTTSSPKRYELTPLRGKLIEHMETITILRQKLCIQLFLRNELTNLTLSSHYMAGSGYVEDEFLPFVGR